MNPTSRSRSRSRSKNTKCSRGRRSLTALAHSTGDAMPNWLQRHLAACPRCRKRAVAMGRAAMGMLLVKTHVQPTDLLMHANQRATAVLSRRIRDLPSARKLRRARPAPSLAMRLTKYTQSIAHAAACLAAMVLLRMGLFQSASKLHDRSAEAIENYYTRQLDQDIVDDLFDKS